MRRLLTSAVLVALILGFAAAQSLNTYTFHQCTCGQSPCPTATNVPSGTCQNTIPFISANVKSSSATCQGTTGLCAQIAFFSDSACTTYVDFISPVCNSCARIGDPSLSAHGDLYSWIQVNCDPNTQLVTILTNCNAGCSSCTGTPELHNFESCVSSASRVDTYVVNQGIQPCTVIQMQEWYGNAQCQGKPDVNRMVSQNVCDEGNMYMCASQPQLTAPPGNVVLTSNCGDGCSYDCEYNTALSGACQSVNGPFGTLYRTDTCNAGISTCVNMLMFQDTACNQFGTAFEITCNFCAQNGGFGGRPTTYLYANCLANNSVVIYDCPDSTCTLSRCTARPIRNVFECALDPQPGTVANGNKHFFGFQSAMNYGVVQCTTVTESWYTTADCSGAPVNTWQLGTGMCSGHGRAICGNFSLRSVQVANCNCVATATTTCPLLNFPSSSCQPMLNYSSGQNIPGWSRQIDCEPKSGTCVRAAIFTDSQCTNFVDIAAPVCGQCDKSIHFGYIKVNCDASTQSTTFSINCNSDCSVCADVGVDPAPIGACHESLGGRFYFQALGFEQCDVVRLTWWNSSSTCSGKSSGSFYRQAGQCAYGESITCAQPPVLPGTSTLPPTGTGREVLHTSCNSGTCSSQCVVTNRESGTCYPVIGVENLSPQANLTVSRRLTCRGDRYCSDLVSFSGTSCAGANFNGVFSAVCGACQLFNSSSKLYQRLNCDPGTQNVWWDLDCDATCNNCGRPGQYVRLLDQCDTAITPGFMILNTGVYPCTGIQVEDFNSVGCGSTGIVRNMTLPQGQCDFGESFACGSFLIPTTRQANVSARTCMCQGAQCPNLGIPSTFLTNQCEAFTMPQFGVLATTIQCPVAPMMCASFAVFNSSTVCTPFQNVLNIVCNACQEFGPGQYVYYDCDSINMKVRTYANCNADCTQCTDPSATVVSFLATCSTAPEFGATKTLLNIRPCDALLKLDFTNSQCQGQTLYAGAIAQSQCLFSQYQFSCSNAPSIAGYGPGVEVLQTVCQDKWCASNCIATVFQSGECINMVGGGSQKFTCSASTGNVCVDFSVHNGTTCNKTSFTPRSAVCGTCVQDLTNGGYLQIAPCTVDAQSITVTAGCNLNCARCTGTPMTVNVSQCSTVNSVWAIRPFNVYPCAALQATTWAGSNCAGTPTFNALVADGDCGVNGRLQCGYNISQNIITNPNANKVGYFDCGCNQGIAGCGHKTFLPNQCQTTLQPNYASTKVRCSNTVGQCIRLTTYLDSKCANYNSSFNSFCGSCVNFGTSHYSVQCNGAIVSLATCTDSTCASCNAATAMPLDRCAPLLNTGIYARALGVQECETVLVEQWYSSTTCSGNPDNIQQVAQGDCNDHAVFQCTLQVPYTSQTTNGNVLITTCAYGSFCTKDCLYQSATQGQCVVTEFGGMSATCLPNPGTCATFGVYQDNQCADGLNIISIACNACQFFPALGYYTYLRCDSVSNNAAFSTHCNTDCSYCANTDVDIRPQYSCIQSLPGTNNLVGTLPYLVNFGVHQCDQIQTNFYTSESCNPSTMNGQVINQASACDSHTVISCGNYELQSLSMQVCGISCGGNCPPQQLAASGQCVALPTGGSATATCGTAQANCANLVMYNGTGCVNANYLLRANPVCGGCLYAEGTGWLQANCDMSTQTVTILRCGKNCVAGSCNAVQDNHPFNSCTASASVAQSIFNLGIYTCDQVTVAYYNTSDCSGQVQEYLNQAQGECAWGLSVICSQPPYQTQNATLAATEVLLQSCPPSSQAGPYCASTSCTTTVYQDGTCFAGNFLQQSRFPANSTQFICRNGRQCGSLLSYPIGDTTCDGNAENIFTIVCNSCAYFNGSYHLSICDMNLRVMTLFEGCDSQCNNCGGQQLVRPEGVCMLSNDGVRHISLRSIFPCTGVEVHTYASNDCDPSSVLVNLTQSAGHCEFGHTFHCGEFNLPPTSVNQATVNVTDCACTNGCYRTVSFLENTCQLQSAIASTFTGSYSATCNSNVGLCVQVHFFGADTCSPMAWEGVNYVACGTCMKIMDGYARLVCDDATQTATVDSMCDSTCSQCSFLSTPHVFTLNTCAPSLRAGNYAVLQGIAPCNTVDIIGYPDSNACGETPGFVQSMAQSMCTPMGVLQCSNAPAWPTGGRFTQVLESFCPGDFGCNTGCTTTLLQSGTCTEFSPYRFGRSDNNAPKMYSKVSCNAAPETCVTVVGFNGTCADNNFMNIVSYVCGSCSWNDRFNIHMKVNCGQSSVTFMNCTDDACGSCSQTWVTLAPQQCVYDAVDSQNPYFRDHPTQVYLRYHAMSPCNTVTFNLYTDSACATTPRASIKHEAGMCDGIVRYQCGNDFSTAAVPTPPPQVAGVGTFLMTLSTRYVEQKFASAMLQYVGAPITSVYTQVSFDGLTVTFYFIGTNALKYQLALSQSVSNNATYTAALFGAASLQFIAPGSPVPTPSGPAGTPVAGGGSGSNDTARNIGIIVAVIAVVIIGAIIFVMIRRRDRNVKGNVTRGDLDEDHYEMYNDQK